jgi:hypothetical protein
MFRLFTLRALPGWQLSQYRSWAILSLAYRVTVCAWFYPVWREPPRQIFHDAAFLEYSFQALSGCDSTQGDESIPHTAFIC